MRITKLHILGLFLLCALAFAGHYYFKQQKNQLKLEQEAAARVEMEKQNAEKEAAEKMAAEPVAPSGGPSADQQGSPGQSPVEYTVQKGDTLWKVAKMQAHFGAGRRWYDIWKANEDKIMDFDRLEAGLVLKIPLDVPENFAWPATTEERKNKITRRLNPQALRTASN